MSYELGHFAIGMAGGIILLYLFPNFFSNILHNNLIKNDLFVILASGFWAIIPDLDKVFDWFPKHADWMNIFWGHHYIDYVFDASDSIMKAIELILIGIIALLWYYHQL